MSILEDFLQGNLQHLPNGAQNTQNGMPFLGGAHHKHHLSQQANVHSAMHGQHTPLCAYPNEAFENSEHQSISRNKSRYLSKIQSQTNSKQAQLNRNKTIPQASAENCLPCHQKNAIDFLDGNTPGVMTFYAPEEQRRATQHPNPQPANINANTRPDNAVVEDAETVARLVSWREEASY